MNLIIPGIDLLSRHLPPGVHCQVYDLLRLPPPFLSATRPNILFSLQMLTSTVHPFPTAISFSQSVQASTLTLNLNLTLVNCLSAQVYLLQQLISVRVCFRFIHLISR